MLALAPVQAFELTTKQVKPLIKTPRCLVTSSLGPVGTSAAILGTANTLGFVISTATGWHYHLDLLGAGAFALSAAATRGVGVTQGLSAAAASLWSVKLASFLFYRVLQTKTDARLVDVLSTTSGAAGFWIASFAWGWIVSLPHTIAAGVPGMFRPAFGLVHALGLSLFASGFILETLADVQKWICAPPVPITPSTSLL